MTVAVSFVDLFVIISVNPCNPWTNQFSIMIYEQEF